MGKPLLNSRTVRGLRALAIRGYELTGQGGSQWMVSRISGDTISGPTGPTTVGTITGYANREQPAQMRGSEAGVSIADAPWRFAIVDAGTITLQSGDTLQSVAMSRLVFTVTGIDTDALFERALINPR